MVADGLTKPLPRQKHEAFIRQLNLTKPPKHETNDAALESSDSQIGSDIDSETATASNLP